MEDNDTTRELEHLSALLNHGAQIPNVSPETRGELADLW